MHVKEQNAPFVCDVESAEQVDSISLDSNKTTSFFKTSFHCLNALSGFGIMSVPYALSSLSSGGWLSLILLFIIASVAFYTGLLTKRCMEVDPNMRSYPDIGDKAFGRKGRILVLVFMNVELFLICTGFLILAGDNLHKLLPFLKTNFHSIRIGRRKSLVVLIALVVMPPIWIEKMTTLSHVSTSGVLASIVILGSILWTGIFDGIGFHQKGVLVNWRGLPTAFSLYTSSSLQVLLVCFLFCTVTHAAMAVMGYLMFGSEIQSHITLNLLTNNLSSKVAIHTALVIPVAKYALILKPVIETIERYLQSYSGKRFYSLILRTILVIISAVIAVTVPFFGYLMSLVGAFLSVTSSMLLPCSCYLKISKAYKKLDFELVSIGLIVIMGLIVLVIGTYTSLVEIIHAL